MVRYEPIFWDIETTGLNPMAEHWWDSGANEVCVVGIGTLDNWRGDKDDAEWDVTIKSGDSEYTLLQEVRETMHGILSNIEGWEGDFYEPLEGEVNPEVFFVGFNSRSFDHTFYGARCSRLRQSTWPFGHQRKRLDGMRVIRKRLNADYSMSQDDWAEHIGLEPHPDDITGKDVPKLVGKGEWDKVEQHCRADIVDLIKIFLEHREEMMGEFYDHYSIDADPSFNAGVDL